MFRHAHVVALAFLLAVPLAACGAPSGTPEPGPAAPASGRLAGDLLGPERSAGRRPARAAGAGHRRQRRGALRQQRRDGGAAAGGGRRGPRPTCSSPRTRGRSARWASRAGWPSCRADVARDLAAPAYRADDGQWVATSARARVIVFDPRVVAEAEVPARSTTVVDPRWRGRIGFAPTNASWQAFVTSIRVLRGEEFAADWLRRVRRQRAASATTTTSPILNAVNDGELAGRPDQPLLLVRQGRRGRPGGGHREAALRPGRRPARAGQRGRRGGDRRRRTRTGGGAAAVRFLLSDQAQRTSPTRPPSTRCDPAVTSTGHALPPLAELQPPGHRPVAALLAAADPRCCSRPACPEPEPRASETRAVRRGPCAAAPTPSPPCSPCWSPRCALTPLGYLAVRALRARHRRGVGRCSWRAAHPGARAAQPGPGRRRDRAPAWCSACSGRGWWRAATCPAGGRPACCWCCRWPCRPTWPGSPGLRDGPGLDGFAGAFLVLTLVSSRTCCCRWRRRCARLTRPWRRSPARSANAINRAVAAAGETGAWARLERGELTVASFCAPFEADCRAHGVEVDGAAVMAAIAAAGVARPIMLEAIRRLRARGLRVGALTNNWKRDGPDDDVIPHRLRAHFDVFVESRVVGLRKPDPRSTCWPAASWAWSRRAPRSSTTSAATSRRRARSG